MVICEENQALEECLCSDYYVVIEAFARDLLAHDFAEEVQDGERRRRRQAKFKAVWSEVMGMTPDGLLLVGKLPKNASGREIGDKRIAAGIKDGNGKVKVLADVGGSGGNGGGKAHSLVFFGMRYYLG